MDINNILDSGGYVHANPEYNPKTKKGKLQPKYFVNADPNGAINQGSALAGIMSQPGRQGYNLDYLGKPEKYAEFGVTINPIDDLNKELDYSQGAFSKLKNAVAQAAVSEVLLGTGKGLSDLVDLVGSKILRVSSDDYTNPVSQYLGELQEEFKEWAPIYHDPTKNINNGGLTDMGWWASNLPSVMSSLTLMIPSTGITKGLSWVGKFANTASKGKLAAFGRNAYKAMTGAGKAKTIEEAEKLNKVTKWLNDTNTITSGQRILETGFNASLMRTMENYQEAHQVYDDMKTQALDKFNSMSDAEYAQFISSQADKLEGVDVNNKEAVADKLAKDSADRTFMIDYANTIFDVIQLNALRNPIKLLKNMRANGAINEAQRASISAIGKATVEGTEAAAQKTGLSATANKFGRGVSQFLKDSKHVVGAELSEGVEEAINYIAQEEGMHYGNVALGEDVKNGFDARLVSYLRSPELYDAAFWGVLGGVVFQGLGSGLNRLSVAAERKYQQNKKKGDDKTKEGVNTDTWQELFETSETKRRVADINARQNDFNDLVNRLKQIEEDKIDPFNIDENNNPLKLETEVEQTIARERAISEYITSMTFRAMDNGNFDMLKAYLQDTGVRQVLEEATGNEGDGGIFIDSIVKRMDNIADKYSQNLIALSNISRNVNIASESAIPIEYLQIIARDNTAAQVKLEDLNARIAIYETSAANKVATYGDKLDKSLNYKDAVQLVVLTQQLAALRAKKAEIENSKDKQGIGRQIELDRINKNIDIVEDMITGQGTLSNSDALTRLLYSTIQSNFTNNKDIYAANLEALVRGDVASILGKETAKKFKTTDEELMKVLGEDKTSGAYKVLATDINSVFEGQYGLNKIDKRLGDDYVALAGLNIEKAVLNENIVMNEANLNKRVNELHNEMKDARTQAIDKSIKILLDLAKKYGRQNVANNLENGQEINWQNEADKKLYDNALEVLNLTSANNQQLYDDVQYAIMMDEFIEASQNAANPTSSESGENSTTSQKPISDDSQLKTDNQSDLDKKTDTGQEKPLNEVQTKQGQQGQEQIQTPTPVIPNGATPVIDDYHIGDTKVASMIWNGYGAYFYNESGILIGGSSMSAEEFERHTGVKPTTTSATERKLKVGDVIEIYDSEGNKQDDSIYKITNITSTPRGDRYNLQSVETSKRVTLDAKDVDNQLGGKYKVIDSTTISSTGEQKSISPTRGFSPDGQPEPDVQREEVKKEIGQTIMNAVKTAKQNGTDATEEINKAVTELNAKYGQDDEYKKEINRMANSWNERAKRQGLAKDVVDLVVLASSVTEEGGTYNFPKEYLNAAKKFADDFLKAVNAKEFNGKQVVSFESMLRFANEQMEDTSTAEYIYKSLKAWFEVNKNKYIILDNMDSTSILQRAAMTDRELASERLGGTNVFRVQIDQFLERVASKAAIDKINAGDTLNAKVDNGDIILMVGDVEVGRLPQPEINSSTGGFKKTNNGWITDVTLTNGNVVSKVRQIWEDILLNKSDINDKINSYIYQIIAARRTNADTKPIKDAIEKDSDLKAYFDGLKQQGIIDKNANNVELIDGLVGIWDYIDLTNPDDTERAADINYSLDLWFNKLYDSYATINNSIAVGVNNLTFKVAKITDGDVIQVAANDNEGYEKCTLGTENEAFANVENTQLGVIRPGSVGVIQTTDNKDVSQPNGSTGSMWAVLPNRSGIPGIVRGHALKFMDTDSKINNTSAGRIRQAISKEFERRIKEFVNDEIDSNSKFNNLVQFIELVLGNNTSTPLLAPIKGGKFNVKNYGNERINIGWQNNDGSYNNFTINLVNRQYHIEGLGFKDIENVDSFINDFKHTVLANAMFNVDFRYLDSDSGSTAINGLATRDKDGNFVITIPNGTDNPLVESFPSFKHFLMQGGAARWNTKNVNGSNFTPRSNNQLRNQILNVSIETNSSSPVEGNVDTYITPETINNGEAIDTILEKRFGKDSSAIKRLKEAGLIPSEITYTKETLMKGDHPSNIWTILSKKKIYVNDEFIKMMQDKPDVAIRKLIHEQLHLKLHGKGNRRKELLNRIEEIYNDFEKSLNREGVNEHIKEYLFNHISSNEEKLEEFLVESLTNRELASYLNSVDATVADTKTKQSLFDKILNLLAEIFDWGVNKGSLYEKELRVLQGFTEETQQVEQPAIKETTVEVTKEEESFDDEFDEDDYDGMASSVREVTTSLSITKEMQSIKERAISEGTFMKAPNGNPTNLTERQWLQVRTKNFKDWFGDWKNDPANASKVVDENGEPLVVYHNSKNSKIDIYDMSKVGTNGGWLYGPGIYTSANKDFNSLFGYIENPLFVNIKRPFKQSYNPEIDDSDDALEQAIFIEETYETKKIPKAFSEKYDGTIANGTDGIEYVAWYPNQIKSATDNNGEFSTKNDNVYASSVQETTVPTVNQFVESLPLEERVEFNNLLLDGTVSMKCS